MGGLDYFRNGEYLVNKINLHGEIFIQPFQYIKVCFDSHKSPYDMFDMNYIFMRNFLI